ncbi:MAG: hypothetical protein F6K30_10370 [Cyanothece sp. SIO2G6]|nr:hypothetical protein [Cyanothece sp. SIO2G6]
MAYSDFKTLDDVKQHLGIRVTSGVSLFQKIPSAMPSDRLQELLAEQVPLALNINTEKARSELIIAPLLLELRQQLKGRISLFSGIDFNVDGSQGLNGFCDFLLSHSPDQIFPTTPVVCLVEAKNENIKQGYGQCIAEMVAAQMFNERQGHSVPKILGVVTTGSNWKFLQYRDQVARIDFDEYFINQSDRILGILIQAFGAIASTP